MRSEHLLLEKAGRVLHSSPATSPHGTLQVKLTRPGPRKHTAVQAHSVPRGL